jgi:hypothetical protein
LESVQVNEEPEIKLSLGGYPRINFGDLN